MYREEFGFVVWDPGSSGTATDLLRDLEQAVLPFLPSCLYGGHFPTFQVAGKLDLLMHVKISTTTMIKAPKMSQYIYISNWHQVKTSFDRKDPVTSQTVINFQIFNLHNILPSMNNRACEFCGNYLFFCKAFLGVLFLDMGIKWLNFASCCLLSQQAIKCQHCGR